MVMLFDVEHIFCGEWTPRGSLPILKEKSYLKGEAVAGLWEDTPIMRQIDKEHSRRIIKKESK